MHASPKRAEKDTEREPLPSRLMQYRIDHGDEDYQPPMPDVGVQYLVDYLWEVGPTMAAGMGTGPITHQEICAWQSLVGVELEPWESRYLRALSIEYSNESYKATERDAPAPWVRLTGRERDLIADRIKNFMSNLPKQRQKGKR